VIRNPYKRYAVLARCRGELAHAAAAVQQAKAAAVPFLEALEAAHAAAACIPAHERRRFREILEGLELEQLAELGQVLNDRLAQAIERSIEERATWPDPELDELPAAPAP
jgi:hypothetical protein